MTELVNDAPNRCVLPTGLAQLPGHAGFPVLVAALAVDPVGVGHLERPAAGERARAPELGPAR